MRRIIAFVAVVALAAPAMGGNVFNMGPGLTSLETVPDGNLLVTSYENKSIVELDGVTGSFVGTFASGNGLNYPAGLVFIPEPATLSLIALAGIAVSRKRRK